MPTQDTLSTLTCDRCGQPIPTHEPLAPDDLCPTCSAQQHQLDAASAHLHRLLWPSVTAWARHWHSAGVSPDVLATLLGIEGTSWHPEGAAMRVGAHEAIQDALNGFSE